MKPPELSLPLLLDTDIGSNVDDALCLAYLLARPECRLIGVTTVSGEAESRARLAAALCRAAGRDDVPVVAGAERPLRVPQTQPSAPGASVLTDADQRRPLPKAGATAFLRETIRAHPGEIHLLAIGPMTNIARLFTEDPEIPSLLRSLTLMCGTFAPDGPGRESPERNARTDPHATAIVFGAAVRRHRSVGLNVTRRVRLDAPAMGALLALPGLRPLRRWAGAWLEGHETVTLNDPLAAATLFDPQICRFARGRVSVEIGEGEVAPAGTTIWAPGGAGSRHEVAFDVDVDRMQAHLGATFA